MDLSALNETNTSTETESEPNKRARTAVSFFDFLNQSQLLRKFAMIFMQSPERDLKDAKGAKEEKQATAVGDSGVMEALLDLDTSNSSTDTLLCSLTRL